MKLEFPHFDGANPSGWLFEAKQYFTYHQVPSEQWFTIASFNMKGEALDWYRWYNDYDPKTTWEAFVPAMDARFGPTRSEDYAGKLYKLTLFDYQCEFSKVINNIFKLQGMPATIVSDCEPVFTSIFWKELFKLQVVQLQITSSYHPEFDGQSEVLNRFLKSYLWFFAGDHPKLWVRWIPLAKWWYNTAFHATTQMTPYQVVYGVAPSTLISYIPGTPTPCPIN